jgi:uncharacterized protein (DUF1501 family)
MANPKGTHGPKGTDGEETTQPTGASRRSFLKGMGAVTAGGVMATMQGTMFRQGAYAGSGQAANVLVVVSLRGGADGLSIVVPWADKNYLTMRPTIGVPSTSLLQKGSMFGLHPSLAPLMPLWQGGQMAAVHAVGLPSPNLSHFSATVAVEQANSGSGPQTGWLNRLVALTDPDCGYAAVQIGNSVPHTQIYGTQPSLCAVDVEDIQVSGPDNAMAQRIAALDVTWDQASGALGEAARDGLETASDWGPVLQAPADPQNGAEYPPTDLGDALAQAARVIRSNVGAEVVAVDHWGWDMHTAIGTLTTGTMHTMIDELAAAVAAFFTDLGALASTVTLVTLSEFGRRVHENGDGGADHGWGNAMLLFGAGVNGGYYANWPGLAGKQTTDGNLTATTDFRTVLCEVVSARFPDVPLSAVFPNFSPGQVGVMKKGTS